MVSCSRIARNHPLPDGNKRVAWASLVVFCELNGFEPNPPASDAVDTIVGVAAGTISEPELAQWIKARAVAMES